MFFLKHAVMRNSYISLKTKDDILSLAHYKKAPLLRLIDFTMKQALNHLKRDPVLAGVIETYGEINYPPPKDIFVSIASSIVGQQLSNKAADTIWSRLIKLFPGNLVTPKAILDLDLATIRTVGTSWAKARSLQDLAQKALDGTLQLNKLDTMSDEEVINHLVLVKGIGRWTAEMRLMFSLGRQDVLPLDDVGIQNAMVKLYGLNRKLKSRPQKMTKIASPWRPYRTIACWYLWKYLDNE